MYIGKAANLKNRLASYRKAADVRILKMLATATDLDWQETGSEIEALILESQLIKKYKPPFNIMLRDDKQYFFVGITKEKFPRIFLTHRPNWANNMPLGPKPGEPVPSVPPKGSPSAIGSKEQLLAQFVGPFTEGASLKSTLKLLRKIFPFCTCKQKHHRYCLNYHLGNCPGFCCLKEVLLSSDRTKVKLYRKNIQALKNILNGKETSVIKNLEKEMNQLAKQGNFEKAIERQNKIVQLKQVFENAKVIKELAGKEKTLVAMKKLFNLPNLPQRIEGYDISNIQGQFATGSMVVFTNGQPDKNEYRKFKIRRILSSEASREGGFGDTQMLAQMLSRRFNHLEWPWPDLILVDGGKGQLSAALSIVPKNIPAFALTKDDKHKGHHIFISTLSFAKAPAGKEKTAMPLSDLSDSVKNLILHIDSEAHRFAISYYRKLHRKTI